MLAIQPQLEPRKFFYRISFTSSYHVYHFWHRFDHDFGAHGEISNILDGAGHSGHQLQETGQEVLLRLMNTFQH